MIRLFNVSLSLREKGVDPVPIMRDVSVEIPTDRRVVIIGENPKVQTEVLSMLAGFRKPDRGWIENNDMRNSPVVNAGSMVGRTLVPQLTAIDNIRLAARIHGIDEMGLIAVVESACRLGKMLWVPVNNFDRPLRRNLEATLIGAIPFDCYYIDRLHEFDGHIIWQFVHVAKMRGAGIFFTSRRPKHAREFAQLGAMVQDGSIELWNDLTNVVSGANH